MWVLEALRCLCECYNRNLVCYEQRRSRKPSQVLGAGVRSRVKQWCERNSVSHRVSQRSYQEMTESRCGGGERGAGP